jgi:glycerol-3-phosphate acyltransferase PlsY
MEWGLLCLAAYLLGSIPFSYLVVKARTGKDVRTLCSSPAGSARRRL